MILSLPVTDLLILALSLQGFVLSGILLYSARKIKSNRWISLLILCISLEAVTPYILQIAYSHSFTAISYILFPVNLALGPLIYFYTRSLIFGDEGLPNKRYLYFLPLLIGLKHQLIWLFYTSGLLAIPFIQGLYFKTAVQNLLFAYSNRFIFLSMASMLIYMVISYRMIAQTTVDKDAPIAKIEDIKWLKKMLQLLFALLVLWVLTIIVKTIFNTSWEHSILFIPAIAFVHWLGFKAYARQAHMVPAEVEIYNKPAANISYFSTTELAEYSTLIYKLMNEERLYLDPLLKLDDIAAKLQLPVKHVSHLLNQHVGKNFNDFINSYRVDEAKLKLADPSLNHFTIAAIAYDCGFNSLPTFQRCFKQFTGLTPSQYQNTLKLSVNQSKQ